MSVDVFDKSLCIICLKGEKLTQTESGCEKIRWAANERKDIVYERLETLKEDDLFYYHVTNSCYRPYTDKNKVLRASKKITEKTDLEQNNDDISKKMTRSQAASKSCGGVKNKNDFCIICDMSSHNKDSTTLRICETKRAENFFQITRFYQDDVFRRTAHLQDAEDVFAADIYYHKNCLRGYELKYERDREKTGSNQCNNNFESISSDGNLLKGKKHAIAEIVETIALQIKSGEIFTLSEIRDQANELQISDMRVENRDVKEYLISNFGETIEFSIPSAPRKPTLFYDSSISLDAIIEKIRPKNIIKESAKIIKKSLSDVDFNLDDKFHDENNLKFSWDNMKIPDACLIFFSSLFNFKEKDFQSVTENQNDKSSVSESKQLKLYALYQIIYYIFKNGKVKTPLHIMNGLSIYNTCKSKSLIQSLNHLGLSISYDEVLKSKTNLALFTVESCSSIVPIPSHFEKTKFTIGAFDNFDHNEATPSGLNSTHDTVCVLFQESSNNLLQKPNISSTTVNKTLRSFDKDLTCQTLKNFYKPAGNIELTSETSVDVLVDPDIFKIVSDNDFAWLLSRMSLCRVADENHISSVQSIPNWSAFNSIVNEDNRNIQKVGFLPVLPYPVTDFSTVYTAMCNFKDVLSQLDQSNFALFCDEGVYRIARHI